MKIKKEEWLILGRINVLLSGGSVICTKCYLCPICGLSPLLNWSFLIGISPCMKQDRNFPICSTPSAINCIHLRWFDMYFLSAYFMPGTIYYILAIMRAKKAWLLSSWSLQSGGWNRYWNGHINESMITNCKDPCTWWVLHDYSVPSFTFCSNSGEELSVPLSKMNFPVLLFTHLPPLNLYQLSFFLLYSQLLSPLGISLQDIILKYLWPTKHKIPNKNFSESYIPIFYFLSLFLLAKLLE